MTDGMKNWEHLEQSGSHALLVRLAHVWKKPMSWKFSCSMADGTFELNASYRYGDWKVQNKIYFTANEVERSMRTDDPESVNVQKKIERMYEDSLHSLMRQMEESAGGPDAQ
jgi:hypothetical protein